jgi:hypothetical protein
MYSLSTKVGYATDITLERIVRLKCYQVQRKKGAKVFTFHSLFLHVFACRSVFLMRFCGYSYFDLLELLEPSRLEQNKLNLDLMNLICLSTFLIYSLIEHSGPYDFPFVKSFIS